MNVGCVDMAAGRGQRFGGNKLLWRRWRARRCSPMALGALPRGGSRALMPSSAMERWKALCGACGVRTVRYPGGPQSDTVRLGIRQMADLDGCLFVQGDQPLLTAGASNGCWTALPPRPERCTACPMTACRAARSFSQMAVSRSGRAHRRAWRHGGGARSGRGHPADAGVFTMGNDGCGYGKKRYPKSKKSWLSQNRKALWQNRLRMRRA